MDSKQIKFLTIGLSLVLLIISLTQNAVVVNYNDELRTDGAIGYFLGGGFAFIGGGFFEGIIWLANPLCFIAVKNWKKDSEKAFWFAVIASALAISFSFWKELLGAESGAMAKIISLQLGYYLWLSSILTLTIGASINYKTALQENLQS